MEEGAVKSQGRCDNRSKGWSGDVIAGFDERDPEPRDVTVSEARKVRGNRFFLEPVTL